MHKGNTVSCRFEPNTFLTPMTGAAQTRAHFHPFLTPGAHLKWPHLQSPFTGATENNWSKQGLCTQQQVEGLLLQSLLLTLECTSVCSRPQALTHIAALCPNPPVAQGQRPHLSLVSPISLFRHLNIYCLNLAC